MIEVSVEKPASWYEWPATKVVVAAYRPRGEIRARLAIPSSRDRLGGLEVLVEELRGDGAAERLLLRDQADAASGRGVDAFADQCR